MLHQFLLLCLSPGPQCDENTTFSNHALYLGLPCCKEDFNSCPNIPSSLIFQRSTKETFWISTQLSSTKLTQNGRWLLSVGSVQGPACRLRLNMHLIIQSNCCGGAEVIL